VVQAVQSAGADPVPPGNPVKSAQASQPPAPALEHAVQPLAHGPQVTPSGFMPNDEEHELGSHCPAPAVSQKSQPVAHGPHDAVVVPATGPVPALAHWSHLSAVVHEEHVSPLSIWQSMQPV